MHGSVSSVGRVQGKPSSGNCFTYRSLERTPAPHDTLHADHVIHSDIIHVEESVKVKVHFVIHVLIQQSFHIQLEVLAVLGHGSWFLACLSWFRQNWGLAKLVEHLVQEPY